MSLPTIAVVLAAGKGTRMRSPLPKVLHRAAGRSLLDWVIAAARAVPCDRIVVVYGHGASAVRQSFAGARDLEWAIQAEQHGTGHALAQAESAIRGAARLLVLSGDVPLLRPPTLRRLLEEASRAWGALAVAELADPGELGRVVAGDGGGLERIIEARDAAPDQLRHRTVNAGLYALPAPAVFGYLRRVRPDNTQHEIYLPDALNLAAADGLDLRCVPLEDPSEAWGVNTPEHLEQVDAVLRARGPAV
ncbi:MAG TPA: NTP transferase domain-containing protein [Thermoanaerobaculia bacterium]|nr:NTP transferase domain-containing protein [Thermoanaerobaculia bacterium]